MVEENKAENKELIFWGEEVYADIMRIKELLATGVLSDLFHTCEKFQQSTFIEIMILLNDLLQKAAKKGLRIAFSDNVQTSEKIEDITDLVNVIRNAACHIPSETRHPMGARFILIIVTGQTFGVKMTDEDGGTVFPLECEFDDDTAFFYASQRIYFHRHIIRAFNEVSAILKPLIHYPEAAWSTGVSATTPEGP